MEKNGTANTTSSSDERKPNSKSRAGILSKLFFLWTFPLFKKGNQKDLTSNDLSLPQDKDLSKGQADRLERNWFEEIANAQRNHRKPSLLRAIFKTFIKSYILDGFLIFFQTMICKAFQPILLAFLIEYFSSGSTTTKEMAYVYASGLICLTIGSTFVQHHTTLRTMQLGMRIRVASCSLLYRKMLRLNSASLGQTTAGQLVNLMSNDVSRFDMLFMFLHHIWIMPMLIVLICYLIYTRVEISALIGVASMALMTLPVQSYMSKLSANLRKKVAVRTDERVRIMHEIISGIQVIKMYAWETPFEKVVSAARAYELSAITKAAYLRGIYMSFMVFTERASLYVTLLAYSLMGSPVTSATVFSLAQFYNTLQAALAIIFPSAISAAAEALVTISRLEKFLVMEERLDLQPKELVDAWEKGNLERNLKTDFVVGKQISKIEDDFGLENKGFDFESVENNVINENNKYAVDISNVTALWTKENETLKDITIKISRGELCAIIGAVGSGKTSILQLLLNELAPVQGYVKTNGNISYCSQEPWLFVGTVRQNILFGLPYDVDRYREVVRVCALEKDFQQFPRRDQTLVGERGVSLSGGQRARINLARCVYRKADIYILDDPLSAVDAHVGKHLFNQCINSYLKDKTVLLVTHQIHFLQIADQIVVLRNGMIEKTGTYSELASSGSDFTKLLSVIQENKETQEHEEKLTVKLKRGPSQISTTYSMRSEYGDDDNEEQVVAEEQISGGMKAKVYWKYWSKGGSLCFILTMVIFMLLGQLSASFSDYWVTYWTNEQSISQDHKNKIQEHDFNTDEYQPFNATASPLISKDDFNIHDKIGHFTTLEYLYIYTGIIISCVILTITRSILLFKTCINASKGLHDQMFHNILKSVMRFFDTNPSGRILNRFSKDIGAVDELLPKAIIEAVQILLVMCSILVLVSISNVWMLPPVLILLIIFYWVFHLYLNTAQDVKRLEGIHRSPIYSHVNASLNGITTIRASNASLRMTNEFDKHQDFHTSAWYEYLACSSTVGFWLDMICVLFLAVVCYSFIAVGFGDVLSGNVGLAISQTLILTGMLQFGIRQCAEIVSQMTSVERILQYNKLEQEANLNTGDIKTPDDWPKLGNVEFRQMFLKYNSSDPPVLQNLNISIKFGWKVGIVGRTGAGKSSLIAALFRLTEIEGVIEIDGIDTKSLSKQDLRSHISIIPQEPVLFSATVRYNLDPFNKYDDAALWSALEAVELKEAVPSLDWKVSEGGSNFSLGQRQLVCLARAILKNNKILVLDEATANVDPQTDLFIQKTIREKFSDCTVLTIAHRLNTIMDSDKVLLMDGGKAIEFDHPHLLLSNPKGSFYSMVKETGTHMAHTLHEIAKKAYFSKKVENETEKNK